MRTHTSGEVWYCQRKRCTLLPHTAPEVWYFQVELTLVFEYYCPRR